MRVRDTRKFTVDTGDSHSHGVGAGSDMESEQRVDSHHWGQDLEAPIRWTRPTTANRAMARVAHLRAPRRHTGLVATAALVRMRNVLYHNDRPAHREGTDTRVEEKLMAHREIDSTVDL